MVASLSSSKEPVVIRTPDQRLRVFVSSTLKELAEERQAVQRAILKLHLAPVLFESGARPHPANQLYQAYLSQSHIFIGIYWQSYGWVAPGMQISGLEDEYNLAAHKPILIYVKTPALSREPGLTRLLERIKSENASSYKYFSDPSQLEELVENDLMLLLSEYFETAAAKVQAPTEPSPRLFTNVPSPRNSLIGRERELASARDLLLSRDAALVTLTGSAGAGKSRLGIQLAHDLSEHFRDGAYLVRLSPVQDPQLVLPAIAKTLGLKEMVERQSLAKSLRDYLSGKQVLLLLDNFEHVIQAAPQIGALLEAAPATKIVITSRAPLRIRPERELAVPPLELPSRKRALSPQQLMHYSAIQLFVERAQSVDLNFQLTIENASTVVEICRRLDGLPLAIELAAARIRMLPPEALLARLKHRFEVLRGGSRDLPARQRTLYQAIEWSYSLLSEDDKRLLQSLSVFVGGWTFESAEAVCNAESAAPLPILDGVERLLDNSLLKPPEEADGVLRMKHFESVRDFAYQHLRQSGTAEMIQEHYASYFLALAERAESKFSQPPNEVWHKKVDVELDNLQAVMRSDIDVGKSQEALRIATALSRFWWIHGYWSEGLQWLESGLAASDGIPVTLKAQALTQAGWLCRLMGDFPRAIALLQKSVALWRQNSDQSGLAVALSNLGASVLRQGDAARAQALAEEALQLSRKHDDKLGIYVSLEVLGFVESRKGNIDEAIGLYTEALALAEQAGDEDHSANLLNNLGDEYMTAGKYEQAEDCFGRAAIISAKLGNRIVSTYIAGNRGAIALKKGTCRQAFDLFCEAMSVLQEMGDKENAILCLDAFAYVAQACGLLERSARLMGACETLRTALGFIRSQPMQAEHDNAISELQSLLGETAFQAAWGEGSAMPFERAISYAVDKSWRPEESDRPTSLSSA